MTAVENEPTVVDGGAAVDLPDEQLPHLETFSKAAELSNFTAAAKALGLTQAAVSQRIQALEKALGRSLFDRRLGQVEGLRRRGEAAPLGGFGEGVQVGEEDATDLHGVTTSQPVLRPAGSSTRSAGSAFLGEL